MGLNRDQYWYQENVPGLILIPRLYLIRILPKPYKKCPSLWIDPGTDTETQKWPRTRPILIPKDLVSAFSIRYWYSRLSLRHTVNIFKNQDDGNVIANTNLEQQNLLCKMDCSPLSSMGSPKKSQSSTPGWCYMCLKCRGVIHCKNVWWSVSCLKHSPWSCWHY